MRKEIYPWQFTARLCKYPSPTYEFVYEKLVIKRLKSGKRGFLKTLYVFWSHDLELYDEIRLKKHDLSQRRLKQLRHFIISNHNRTFSTYERR